MNLQQADTSKKENAVGQDEELIFSGRIPMHVFHFSHGIIWLLVVGWNVGIIWSWLSSLGWDLKITTKRVVSIKGIISQHEEQVEYYRVQDIQFSQTVIQRLASVGEITVLSDDPTTPELTFPIHDPQELKEKMAEKIRIQRQEMGAIQMD
jgi:membrane protein YdbS with pleckstrin-like domain